VANQWNEPCERAWLLSHCSLKKGDASANITTFQSHLTSPSSFHKSELPRPLCKCASHAVFFNDRTVWGLLIFDRLKHDAAKPRLVRPASDALDETDVAVIGVPRVHVLGPKTAADARIEKTKPASVFVRSFFGARGTQASRIARTFRLPAPTNRTGLRGVFGASTGLEKRRHHTQGESNVTL